MCAQFFHQQEISAKSPDSMKAPVVGLSDALGPQEMKGLEVGCCLFVSGPHPDTLGCPLDPLFLSFPPFVHTWLSPKSCSQHMWALQKHSPTVLIPETPLSYEQKIHLGI